MDFDDSFTMADFVAVLILKCSLHIFSDAGDSGAPNFFPKLTDWPGLPRIGGVHEVPRGHLRRSSVLVINSTQVRNLGGHTVY